MASTSTVVTRTPVRVGANGSVGNRLGSGASSAASSAAPKSALRTGRATTRRTTTTSTPKAKLNINFSAVRGTSTPRGTPPVRKPLGVVGISTGATSKENVDISKILQGVFAMVDVRLGADGEIDCSDAVAKKLTQMGATIMKKKTGKLTHVVVSHFTPQWKEKVNKWHSISTPVEVVSQLWVNACFTNKQRVKEGSFFPVNKGFETGSVTPARATNALKGSRTTLPKKDAAPATRKRAPTTPAAKKISTLSTVLTTPTNLKNGDLVTSTPTPRATGSARKRRAASMEPMPSDAILKLLGSNSKKLQKQNSASDVRSARSRSGQDDLLSTPTKKPLPEPSTPPLTVRLRAVMERRRRTIDGSSTVALELQSLSQVNQATECVSESCSEGEPEASAPTSKTASTETCPVNAEKTSAIPEPVAQTSMSLSLQSPAVPSKGEWACSICSCLNAKTRRLCKGCKASRVAAKTSVTDKTPSKRANAKTASATPTRRRSVCAKPQPDTPSSLASTTPKSQKPPLSSSKSPARPKRPRSTSSNEKQTSSVCSSNDLFAAEKLESTTPQRPPKKQKTTTTASTTSKAITSAKKAAPPRAVIGITGVDNGTRSVIECAVHGIDANMAAEVGHRKARVVKSLDYAAGVTHLVVGPEMKRTIKVLFAIARGAWIVSQGWVFSSLDKEQWLNEEEFELDAFPKRQSRAEPEQRQVFRSLKFFVGAKVDPSREVLISLIQCAGGEIVNQISVADYCICGDDTLFRRAHRTGIKGVAPKWVFDSIAHLKLESTDGYGPNANKPDDA